MSMRSLLALHGLRFDSKKLETPYDHPRTLLERLTFPSLRAAWRDGYVASAREDRAAAAWFSADKSPDLPTTEGEPNG